MFPELLEIIFPRYCINCRQIGTYLCQDCQRLIKYSPTQRCTFCNRRSITGSTHPRCFSPWSIDGVWAAAQYTGVIKSLIRQWKYNSNYRITPFVVQVITHHLPTALTGFDLIIPIPLYPARFRFRGYNQADELARSLSLQLRIPVNSKILTKTHDNPPQARYNTRKQRLINLQQAFSINQPALRKKIKNKSIILLDDIATTGTTLRQAALPLKRAGAARVWGVVVAR